MVVLCRHLVIQPHFEPYAWAGPVGHCDCCGLSFTFIDWAWGDTKGFSEGREWRPRNRCGHCGGDYEYHRRYLEAVPSRVAGPKGKLP